jgi:hypothetical protein
MLLLLLLLMLLSRSHAVHATSNRHASADKQRYDLPH